MGRIKTRLIKAITHELLDEYSDSFTTSYEKNKLILADKVDIKSKKLRNIVAGYATRMVRAKAN